MLKIGLILKDETHVRSFFSTGALNEVAKKNDLILMKPSELSLSLIQKKLFIKIYDLNLDNYANQQNFYLFQNALRFSKRHKSKTFRYKESQNLSILILRKYADKFFKIFNRPNIKYKNLLKYNDSQNYKNFAKSELHIGYYQTLMSILSNLNFVIRYRIMSLPPLLQFAPFMLKINKIQDMTFADVLKKENFDIVLFVSTAMDSYVYDLIKVCSNLKTQTYCLTENWDNLSSKSVFWKKPDYISTWGEQGVIHAKEIHGFHENQIFNIGSARFMKYQIDVKSNAKSRLLLPDNYVLYVGSSVPYDEIASIIEINNEILGNPKIYKNLNVIYRPHPDSRTTQSVRHLNTLGLSRVLVDPQILSELDKSSLNQSINSGRLNLDFYNILLSNSNFVVGGLTSMLIEASLFNKKFLACVYEELSNVVNSPHLQLRNYTHLEGIDTLPNIFFCEGIQRIKTDFRRVFNTSTKEFGNKELDFFVNTDLRNFDKRLSDSIEQIRLRRL